MNEQGVKVDVLARLAALLPELEYSRETHVQWANCSPESRARNPDIGDAAFHNECVAIYDERIGTIKDVSEIMADLIEVLKAGKECNGGDRIAFTGCDADRLRAALARCQPATRPQGE